MNYLITQDKLAITLAGSDEMSVGRGVERLSLTLKLLRCVRRSNLGNLCSF